MSAGFLDAGPVLVIGAGGQLGGEFARLLADRGIDHRLADVDGAPNLLRVDMMQPEQLAALVRSVRPSVVINAAAYTAVDRAESEREQATSVNAAGPEALASACHRTGALLVHFSTDYVFDGQLGRDYVERDPVSPLNHYGATKARGEALVCASPGPHLVFRTSWLYTPGGRNFVATMLRLFAGDGPVRVVDDQWGCPTWARPLARQVLSLIERSAREHLSERSGLYHLCGGGACSWYQFACAIRELADPPARAQVQAIDSATFAAPARRPQRVVLSCEHARRALGLQLEEWRAQITQAMPEFNARSCDGKR